MAPASNGMAYTDLSVQNLWESSRMQKGSQGILCSFLGGAAGADVTGANLKKHLRDIELVFPGAQRRFNQKSITWNWTSYPFNLGSYSSSKIGQSTHFLKIAQTSELAGKLLFAGEHASDSFDGFMNGGCRSGRVAAQAILRDLA